MTNVQRIIEFIDFAEKAQATEEANAEIRQTWRQKVWGWIDAGVLDEDHRPSFHGQYLSLSDEEKEELARSARNGTCQTAFCAAGHGAFLAGYRFLYSEAHLNGIDGQTWGLTTGQCIKEEPTGQKDEQGRDIWAIAKGANRRLIADVGREWFGFTHSEGSAFFDSGNQLWVLKGYANGFAVEENMEPPYPDMPLLTYRSLGDDDGYTEPTRWTLEEALVEFPIPVAV